MDGRFSAGMLHNPSEDVVEAIVKAASIVVVLLLATLMAAQGKPDEAAIRGILDDETVTWNKGDSDGYSRHFAENGTFTNVLGMFFSGHQAFQDRHEEIFKGRFRGTTLRLEIVSLRFVRPDVAIVETLTWVSGFSNQGPPPGAHTDTKGRLCTRLLQVLVKNGGEWKIVVYHNVDVKAVVAVPEPRL